MTDTHFIFVGWKRSQAAIEKNVRWEDGRLSAKTLFDALAACGIPPQRQQFMNLYRDGLGWHLQPHILSQLRALSRTCPIVALGRRVQVALTQAAIPHIAMTHPAARGTIRNKHAYCVHVAHCLQPHKETSA